jgi:CMP-N,N'-diacetyllegionaminic acid synthase
MSYKNKIIAIIPVRKNSKGIKNKNLLKIAGETLLDRAIKFCKKNSLISRTIVSTDSKKMMKIAKKYNVAQNYLRKKSLSNDTAKTIDVIKDVIKSEKLNINDFILLVQVTSPLRTQLILNKFINFFFKKKKFKSSVTVTFFDSPHPDKVQFINKKGQLKSYLGVESMVPRQKLKKVFFLNGMFYIARIKDLIKLNTFFINPVLPFIVEKNRSINLDNTEDVKQLRDIYKKNN